MKKLMMIVALFVVSESIAFAQTNGGLASPLPVLEKAFQRWTSGNNIYPKKDQDAVKGAYQKYLGELNECLADYDAARGDRAKLTAAWKICDPDTAGTQKVLRFAVYTSRRNYMIAVKQAGSALERQRMMERFAAFEQEGDGALFDEMHSARDYFEERGIEL